MGRNGGTNFNARSPTKHGLVEPQQKRNRLAPSCSFRAFGRSRSLPLPRSSPSLFGTPRLSLQCLSELVMVIPGPYSGVSTLAFVARASAFTYGVVYGSIKLSYLRVFVL
ncbi:hypothetical protein BHE74_00028564 [Ensete ventricosum]|nr:hypothetical protein BHE74_00028564 [Ensete ventricosum]RZS06840.1 hypothetical protein BHM03_00037557 [Ensete ventricosum]